MSGEACTLPNGAGEDEQQRIERMLRAKRIAIVGLSEDPTRPSYRIASYLRASGYEVVPVNPTHPRVMGLTSYPSLSAVPGRVDLVNVFRRSEFCADVARDAVAIGAGGLWLQSGIVNDEAREIAGRGKMDYVENRCIMVEHMTRG